MEKLVDGFIVPLEQEKKMSEQKKEGENKLDESAPTASTPPPAVEAVKQDEKPDPEPDVTREIADLKAEVQSLRKHITRAAKPPEPPKPLPETPNTKACKPCVLTKEGFWQRFHQLRSEGLSKSDAFRVVSIEVIETASKTGKP